MAFFVYGVLLAGMIGSLLKHTLLRAKERSEQVPVGDMAEAGAFLFVGTIAAFAVAVLLPTALLVPSPTGIDPFVAVNKWGLTMLAAAVGYASRETLGDLGATLRQLFDGSPAAAIADIEGRVEAGLRKAIAPPPLANFEGNIAIGLHDKQGVWKLTEGTGFVSADVSYDLAVFIGSSPNDTPPLGLVAKQLTVTDGADLAEVTFDLFVDASSIGVPLARKSVTVTVVGASTFVRFDIVPRLSEAQAPSDPATANEAHYAASSEPNAAAADGGDQRRAQHIQLSIYQGAVFCGDVRLPVELSSSPIST